MYFVADFIIRVKNASLANRHEVLMPYSNIVMAIGKVLVKEGYLAEVKEEKVDDHRVVKASLRFVRRKPVIHEVEVISKPSLRVYKESKSLRKTGGRVVTTVLSTSSGVMTGKDAQKKGIGGELLFAIW